MPQEKSIITGLHDQGKPGNLRNFKSIFPVREMLGNFNIANFKSIIPISEMSGNFKIAKMSWKCQEILWGKKN